MLYTPPRRSPLPRILRWLGFAITLLVFITGLGTVQDQQRRTERVRAIGIAQQQAAPLIAAIRCHTREKGQPPLHLTALPTLPNPGPLSGKLGWRYQALTRNRWQLELRVDSALAIDGRMDDRLVYRSDRQYDIDDDQYAIERFGDWAYYFRR